MSEKGKDIMENQYICINCSVPVKRLFKKYSSSVLKLTECDSCKCIADKYVEYDISIIIIDLVLLKKEAYRHVLFNVHFKNFWKLSVIFLLMEAYSELMRRSSVQYVGSDEKEPFLNEFDEMADFLFYKLSLSVAIRTMCFISILYILTQAYCVFMRREFITFLHVWKCLTVSSFGIFLLLPSLIWDTSIHEFHLCVVSLYTTLSQLLAFTMLCNCHRIWSIFAICCAYYGKIYVFDFFDFIFPEIIIKSV